MVLLASLVVPPILSYPMLSYPGSVSPLGVTAVDLLDYVATSRLNRRCLSFIPLRSEVIFLLSSSERAELADGCLLLLCFDFCFSYLL